MLPDAHIDPGRAWGHSSAAKLRELFAGGAEALLALVYPNVCQLCRAAPARAGEGYVCASCWTQPGGIRFITPPFCQRCGLPYEGEITQEFECGNCREMDLHFSSARAAVAARGIVLEVIHRYRYGRALWFEPFLADLLARQAVPVLVVPVPLHPVKRREREFNQAERLARHLSRATGIPDRKDLLWRIAPTQTQTLLSRQERAVNVSKAFRVRNREAVQGGRFILLDDVLTTGATASACAKVLQRNGAHEVCVWTVARGL
jgi:competence protein ComFC